MKRVSRKRVPIVRQLAAAECAAACLTMILGYYGRRTTLSECRLNMGTGRDGTTALGITKAARKYGLRVKAYSLEPADFRFVTLPAIVHWDFNHFVVVERWSPKYVEIVDPATGRDRLSAEQFAKAFTGVVLSFEPGVEFERLHQATNQTWHRFLFRYIFHAPGALIQIILASLLLQVLGLALPAFTKILIDSVLPFHITSLMNILGTGMILVVLTQLITSYLRSTLLLYLQAKIDTQVMLNFFEHLLALPFSFFQQRTSGDLLMRMGSNTVIREILTGQTISVVLDGSLVILYLILLLILAPTFGLLVLGVGALQVAVLAATTGRVHRLMQRDLAAQSQSQSYIVEALTRIEVLKASGVEYRAFERWSNLFFNQLNISLQRGHLSALIETWMMTLRIFSPLLLLWYGAGRVLDGTMSLGSMLSFNVLAASFFAPLNSLVSNGQRLQLVGSHIDRIADVLEAEAEQDTGKVMEAPQLTGCVEFEHVSFRYGPDTPLVLRDISFTIEAGQKVALVGRTGSGKSTLAKLLLGLYVPTEGAIRYDNIPVQTMNYRSLRGQFGVVWQDSPLFSGSIRQNIAFSDPNMTLEQVIEAAKIAHVHEDIMKMQMNYETLVPEGNSGLAGGQSQRISIARAVARRPAILLLDEATSHLDVLTERAVDENLGRLSCTRIVIAHRLSTISNADLILVLDDGEIVERGTHEELSAQDKYYAALVNTQTGVSAH